MQSQYAASLITCDNIIITQRSNVSNLICNINFASSFELTYHCVIYYIEFTVFGG